MNRESNGRINDLSANLVTGHILILIHSTDVDGDKNSSWKSKEDGEQWFAIDLTEIQSVSRVELSGQWGFIPNNSSIQVSNDGKNWRTVYTKLVNDFLIDVGNIETFHFETTQTRWIRILFPESEENKRRALTEFSVYN